MSDELMKHVLALEIEMAQWRKMEVALPGVLTKTDTGDPAGVEGTFCINTFDNNFKVFSDGAWRTLSSW